VKLTFFSKERAYAIATTEREIGGQNGDQVSIATRKKPDHG
jgi:hypothetical protein